MGHAHHFLSRLDRVSYDEVELSLGLYNNAPLVKYVLARAGLPPGAERVAISLGDRSEGPFLIVTREGRFVTCLGRGMRCDIPVVRRWQLDLLASRHEGLAACMRPAAAMAEHERPTVRLLERLRRVGPGLSREEFVDLSVLQPMLFGHYAAMLNQCDDWLTVARHNARHIERPRPFQHELLENIWRYLWALQHLSALLGVGAPIEYLEDATEAQLAAITTSVGYVHGGHLDFPASAAGAWLTARFAGAYLPICAHRFQRATTSSSVRQAALEVSAIAGAHPHLAEPARRLFLDLQPRAAPGDSYCQPEERARFAAMAARALEGPDLDVRAALWGAERAFACGQAAARHGWRSVADVPLDVAMPFAVRAYDQRQDDDDAVARLFHLAPAIARFRPEDFYLPARWLREFPLAWTPEHTMGHLRALRGYYLSAAPRVAARAPGRNEPCACGSGVKFKRCCAGAPKVAAPPAPAAPEEPAPTLLDGVKPRARRPAAPASEPPPALDPADETPEAPANDDAAAPVAANDDAAADARRVA